MQDRTELWLSLLGRLTELFPRWAVWKNADSAFTGSGDVDSLAPPGDWPAIQECFRDWSAERGLGPVIVCRHIPQGPHFMTFQPGASHIIQLDVKTRGTFRGSTLIDVDRLLPLSEVDQRGFRRIRPGAEGLIKLCMNGTRRGGRPDREALDSKAVADLLTSDPEGVQAGAELLGAPTAALIAGAQAVVEGGWDTAAMRRVELAAWLRGLAEPGVAASRIWFLTWAIKRCPVMALIRHHDRRVPGDLTAWLGTVATDHEIYPTGPDVA